MDYYYNAIEKISENVIDPHFFIFSNDIDWVKKNLDLYLNKLKYTFVDNSNIDDSSIADLYLMSRCKHHIIANSTFSWWGAWLNPSTDKVVIAPARWYVGELNNSTVDLIPSNWIRL